MIERLILLIAVQGLICSVNIEIQAESAEDVEVYGTKFVALVFVADGAHGVVPVLVVQRHVPIYATHFLSILLLLKNH